ncbi:DUF445 family protein, partial [Staphylococcus succinus]
GLLLNQIDKLKQEHSTIQYFADKLDIDVAQLANEKLNLVISTKLDAFYHDYQHTAIKDILPNDIEQSLDSKVDLIPDLLFDRARIYLSSDKGATDISSMLETFFQEKGKIVGLLQMFMTKESIAERIQHELIRLTKHPKAKEIANQIIDSEYQTMKSKHLNEVVTVEQFDSFKDSATELAIGYIDAQSVSNKSLSSLMPSFISFLESKVTQTITDAIIDNASKHITPIMKKINLKQMIEEQVNTFELDYIERLIIDIANKELKLIMMLGFLLGGIIGLLQGVIAIFV